MTDLYHLCRLLKEELNELTNDNDEIFVYHVTNKDNIPIILESGYLYSISDLVKQDPNKFKNTIKDYGSRLKPKHLETYSKNLSDLEKAKIYWELMSKPMCDFLGIEYTNYGIYLTLLDYSLFDPSINFYFKIPLYVLDPKYSVNFIKSKNEYYSISEINCKKLLERFPIDVVKKIRETNGRLKHRGLPQLVSYKPIKVDKSMLVYW